MCVYRERSACRRWSSIIATPDPGHGAHEADKSCVMYWAYDGDATVDAVLTNLIGGGGQLDYCQTNLDDIDAAKR